MQFWKGHALGNDYIVLDGTGESPPDGTVIRGLCDRHRGVGADGVLVADLDADPVGLRIFNPDGAEAEKSGNGLRIFGAWLDGRGHTGEDPFQVALPGETVEMSVQARRDDGTLTVRVDMGRPTFRARDIGFGGVDPDGEVSGHPLDIEGEHVDIHLVSFGNPHCVVFVDDLDVAEFRERAPVIQAHPDFERGVNVQFARPVGPALLEARIWERGAGETLASGSSACAVAIAARRAGLVSASDIQVRMPGGSVTVHISDDGGVHLTGAAQMLFSGEVGEAVAAGWA